MKPKPELSSSSDNLLSFRTVQTCCSSASRASAAWAEPSSPSSSALREALLSVGQEGSTERALKLDRRSNTRPRPARSPPEERGHSEERSHSDSVSRSNRTEQT